MLAELVDDIGNYIADEASGISNTIETEADYDG